MRRIRSRLTYANVVATLALVIAVAGGTAYAANTVLSTDIVNDQVYSADVRNDTLAGGGLTAADLRNGSVGNTEIADGGVRSADVQNESLTGADIKEQALDVVQGRGTFLSNRIVRTPAVGDDLLVIPGLGKLVGDCGNSRAEIAFLNTTAGPVDVWIERVPESGDWLGFVMSPGEENGHSFVNSDFNEGATLSLGSGNDPGPRRTATVDAFAFQEADGFPCGFQAQGTLWTSE